jgi:hypothetical protein
MKVKAIFKAEEFKATKWDSAQVKAYFANKFIDFVLTDYKASKFSQKFYNRLSQTFGHIAHYHRLNFYAHFFTSEQGKMDFIRQTMNFPCYGDPEYTYSDVEKALQKVLRKEAQVIRYL